MPGYFGHHSSASYHLWFGRLHQSWALRTRAAGGAARVGWSLVSGCDLGVIWARPRQVRVRIPPKASWSGSARGSAALMSYFEEVTAGRSKPALAWPTACDRARAMAEAAAEPEPSGVLPAYCGGRASARCR